MEPKVNRYKNYSIQDFLWDEDFIAWCKNKPEADHELWSQVLETYPEQANNITDAGNFLLKSRVKDQLPSAEQTQRIWKGIADELHAAKPKTLVRKLGWLRVAAVLLLTIGAGVLADYALIKDQKTHTEYAEIKHLELPDHSKITLNANSSIRYAKKWDVNKPREVWLSGEAFFEVAHLHQQTGPVKPGERFIVHANGVDIEVLGTSFNVNNRHDAARISLTSGSIELKFADKKLKNIVMKPGDVVNYEKAAKAIDKQTTNPVIESAWKDLHWTFDNSSLKEILQLLKDNYGLEATVEDPELWNKSISGTISSDNIDIVVKSLSVLLDIQIEQKDKTLVLKNK